MDDWYQTYVSTTHAASDACGGSIVYLAGGHWGFSLPLDGTYAVVAYDIDGSGDWYAWREDRDGERCCDWGEVNLGPVWPEEYAGIPTYAARAILEHVCIWQRAGSASVTTAGALPEPFQVHSTDSTREARHGR